MSKVTFRLIESPEDPAIEGVHRLMLDLFPQSCQVPPKERWLGYLRRPWSPSHRYFLLAGFDGDRPASAGQPSLRRRLRRGESYGEQRPVMFSAFNYVRRINCGYGEFIGISKKSQGGGLGRALFQHVVDTMNREAKKNGHKTVDAFFADMEDPYRMTPEDIEAERRQAIDPFERLKLWHHFGFWRVDMPFVIAPLMPGCAEVTMNIQICLPFRDDWRRQRAMPTEASYGAASWIIRHWAPDSYRPYAERMRRAMPRNGKVKLVPLV